ncbi:MAG TPA: hypothetical protein VFG78_07385, partial [Gemmatimonadota bacterium]|nr:hypothetical protein [Gemmatimonadota bacterium]
MKMRPLLPILVLGFACGGEGVDIVDRGESHFIVYGFAGGGVLNPFDHLILRGAIHVPDCRS